MEGGREAAPPAGEPDSLREKVADRVGVAPENKPAASFTVALATLTGVLTAAGVTEGVVGRMVGESPWLFRIAGIAALFAGLLGTAAGLFTSKSEHPGWELGLLLGSNVLLFVGLVAGVFGAAAVWSNTRAPTLSAALKTQDDITVLEVSVKDSGLDSKEHVRLLVEEVPLGGNGDTIYSAWLGSNEDGKLDHSVDVPLPPDMTGRVGARAYVGDPSANCYLEAGDGEACLETDVPHDPEDLQLSAKWEGEKKTLSGGLQAQHIAGTTVHLRAIGQVRAKPRLNRLLEKWQLSPNVNGAFEHDFSIGGVSRFAWICVVADTDEVGKCPPPENTRSDVVWARYRVPGD